MSDLLIIGKPTSLMNKLWEYPEEQIWNTLWKMDIYQSWSAYANSQHSMTMRPIQHAKSIPTLL